MNNKPAAIIGGLLALGLIISSALVGNSISNFKKADRAVTVKGLAEREVKANLALWPISFSVSANSLDSLQSQLTVAEGKIHAFLQRYGFSKEDISSAPSQVIDNWADRYNQNTPKERYRAQAVVVVRTKQVDLVKDTMIKTGELVKEGVLLTPSYEHRTEFLFTDLNAIKPEMIAEATQDARRAAMQFAEDSGSKVGSIRSATQGYFSVSDLDNYTPDIKNVRVVTTVEYYLR